MKPRNAQKAGVVFFALSLVLLQTVPLGVAAPDVSSDPRVSNPPTVRVTTSAELVNALNRATGGEEIVLAAGNYAPIDFSNKQYTSYVTIRSEDPVRRAVFDTLHLTNVSYMRFRGVVIHHDRLPTDTDYTRAFYVKHSNHLEVLDSEFHGSVDGIYNNDVRGFGTSLTQDVLFEGNVLHDLYIGGTFYDTDHVIVRNNTFKNIRCDGVAFQSASHVLVENNFFTSFHPVLTGAQPDHMDFIQFWNSTATKDMTDIVIRGNVMLRGTGDYMQSIFIETKSDNGLYVGRDILIERNVIYNGKMQGITVYDVASGLIIQHNTVLADWLGDIANWRTYPRLELVRTTNAIVRYNVLTYYDPEGDTGTVYQDNVMVQFTSGTNNNYAQLFSGAKNFGPAVTLRDFTPLAGGPLVREGKDIGAL